MIEIPDKGLRIFMCRERNFNYYINAIRHLYPDCPSLKKLSHCCGFDGKPCDAQAYRIVKEIKPRRGIR